MIEYFKSEHGFKIRKVSLKELQKIDSVYKYIIVFTDKECKFITSKDIKLLCGDDDVTYKKVLKCKKDSDRGLAKHREYLLRQGDRY